MAEQTELGRFIHSSAGEEIYDSKHWLAREYWTEDLIQEEIAELAGVSGSETSSLMRKHDVGTRSEMESRPRGESKPDDDEDWSVEK